MRVTESMKRMRKRQKEIFCLFSFFSFASSSFAAFFSFSLWTTAIRPAVLSLLLSQFHRALHVEGKRMKQTEGREKESDVEDKSFSASSRKIQERREKTHFGYEKKMEKKITRTMNWWSKRETLHWLEKNCWTECYQKMKIFFTRHEQFVFISKCESSLWWLFSSNIQYGLNKRTENSCAIKEITNDRSRQEEMMSYRGNLFLKDNLAKRNRRMKSPKK